MALSIGIVGLPNVGKSTLFTALTKKGGLAANYPFATIDPNVGIVDVPDDRLQALADIVHPGRIVPATVEFVDIAGLVKGAAAEGAGLGNQFLANIRECSAICQVVRYFKDPDVMRQVNHTGAFVDPASDARPSRPSSSWPTSKRLKSNCPSSRRRPNATRSSCPSSRMPSAWSRG